MNQPTYLIRYRFQNKGQTRTIMISAENESLAMVQFKELYPKNVPVGLYLMTPIQLTNALLNVTRSTIGTPASKFQGDLHQ